MTDMTRWMLMQLGTPGEFDGRTYVSARTMRDIQTPQVSQNIGSVTAPLRGYGLGLRHYRLRRRDRVLSHGGATDGMNTTYMLIPEYEFGIIITTNVFTTFREAVAYTVIDHMLGIEDGNDWNRLFYTNYTSRYETVKRQREEFEATRIRNTRPSHALRNYTGSWHNDQYDNAEVRLRAARRPGTLTLG
jgi:CubicO group peptidase (beta-lactamase class C family)